jgi:divalent metal cation (Fe/Co/Zn/Cd) transporter
MRREKRDVAGNSVLAALLVTSLKIAVGIATASLGILSEAAHSGLDLIAALVTFFSVRVSESPPTPIISTAMASSKTFRPSLKPACYC